MKSNKDKLVYILFFVLFLNLFFFHKVESIGGTLILAGLWVLMVKIFAEGKKSFVMALVGGSLAVVATTLLGQIYVAGEMRTLLLMGAYFLTMFFTTYAFMRKYLPGSLLESILSIPSVIGEYIRSGLEILRGLLTGNLWRELSVTHKSSNQPKAFRPYLVGLVVGLPVVMWLIMLLIKADPVFEAFVRKLVSEQFLKELPGRLAISAFFLILLIPATVMRMRKSYVSPLTFLSRTNWVREITVVVAMVGIVMGAFLVVQWPYVFVSVPKETSLASFGVATYSEYVQKGFGELLKVAGLVFALSWISLLIYRGAESLRERRPLLFLQGVLGIEFVLFLISIFRRVALYTTYHGLSLARLYGLVFLIWLLGMTVTMGMRYFRKTSYARHELAWGLLIIILSVSLNFEKMLVTNPPTVNGRVDYVYLSRLSADGYEGWKKAYDNANEILEQQVLAEGPNGHIGFINKESRREIYYADLAARKLTMNYHSLIMRYGTDQEVRDYMRKVITNKKETVSGFTVESFTYNSKSEYFVTQDGMQYAAPETVKKTQYLAMLDGYLAKLNEDNWQDKINIDVIRSDNFRAWEWMRSNPYMDVDISYYIISESKDKERLRGMDRFLSWNWGRQNVYRRMRAEIGEDKLLELQARSMTLLQKIGLQPEVERGFDVDISLDSPFLQ